MANSTGKEGAVGTIDREVEKDEGAIKLAASDAGPGWKVGLWFGLGTGAKNRLAMKGSVNA